MYLDRRLLLQVNPLSHDVIPNPSAIYSFAFYVVMHIALFHKRKMVARGPDGQNITEVNL